MTPYEHAKAYAANGFCVIPIRLWYPGEDLGNAKKPTVKTKGYQTVKPREDEMRRWWNNSNPCGLAILHGSISGFSEMLEAESLEDLEEFKQRLESHGLSYILEKLTLQVASPGGGIHFIYRCPELGSLERTPGNERLASRYLLDDSGNRIPNRKKTGEITKGYRQKPKLETRAQGGYAIVPGSPLEVHPSRKPYALISGSFDAVPEITKDEREILFTFARECDAIEKEPVREKTSTPTVYSEHQGEKAADSYSRQATLDMLLDLLEDMGATGIKEGDRYLIARPGKDLKESHSAVLGGGGGNAFWNWSTSWGEFEAEKAYTPFGVYAIAKHGGDLKAAAKDLGRQGYGFNPGYETVKDFTTKQKPQSELDLDFPEKPIPDLTGQNQTDAGNAERLIALHKGNILYSHRVGWMVWNEKYWIQQDTDNLQIAKLFLDAMRETARQSYELFSKIREDASKEDREAEHKRITKLASFALNSENAQKITNGIKVAKSLPGVSVDPSKFEPKPWVVPFQNGVWDRGEWKEGHIRERYIERLLPVDYDPEADPTEWNALLERITNGDKELEVTLGELAATVLVAAPLRKIIIFYGEPGTGKSTLAEMLLTVLGECGVTIQSASLVEQKDDSRLGGIIRGKRGLFIAEAGKRPFDTELLKNLSGGDPIPCRLLYQNEGITIRSTWNIVMTSNDAPRIDSYDQGLRERLVAVPFLNRLDAGKHLTFTGHKRIEDARKDTNSLLIKGFAAWLVEGMNRLYSRPLHDAHLAPLVSEHTKKLIRDADPLTEFWEWYENEHEGALETGVSGLHKVYVAWCADQGIRPVSTKTFSKGAKSYGLTLKRTGSYRYWIKEMTSNDANDAKTQILESVVKESYIEKLSEKGVMASLRHLDSPKYEDEIVEEGLFEVQGEEL
jgi:P4 family phage/plasmid primase-like protien